MATRDFPPQAGGMARAAACREKRELLIVATDPLKWARVTQALRGSADRITEVTALRRMSAPTEGWRRLILLFGRGWQRP